ncbi:MAG: MiaB/RimO family radical SAM methylthiotransferase [Lachnospiraceae bacterium]|nr:MiaB/RimO family radical SAM methylthiotransferase [Lachnospiraceae bacterium]
MQKVALHNLGCKVNSYELDVIGQKLEEKGYSIVPFDEKADVYIINTCTVTNIADRKSRQMLHQAKKRNPEAVVVAVGCYVQTGKEQVLQDAGIDLAIGNNKKKDLVEILEAYLADKADTGCVDKTMYDTSVIDINATYDYEEMQLTHTAEHTRAYIKVQDGCNQFCSYCIIPFARGRVRSRHLDNIRKEVEGLAKAGYKEIVLTGIHISSYGIDFEDDAWAEGKCVEKPQSRERHDYSGAGKLLDLVERIHDISGIERIRLGSLEPRIVTQESAKRLAALPKICPHFHLSLQSGCDETLKRMNRKYSTVQFRGSVQALRDAFDNPAITTDVIVGFPGETEEEFGQTVQYLEELSLYEMHIFKYSVRKGTRAAVMKGQLTEVIKTKRSAVLLGMEARKSKEYRSQFVDKRVAVLFEEEKEVCGKTYMIGHTREYVKVALPLESVSRDVNLTNHIIEVEVKDFLTDDILLAR